MRAPLSILLLVLIPAVGHAQYVFEQLPAPGTAALTTARGINEAGVVVGSSGNDGVIWDHGTVSTFTCPGAWSTYPNAINDAGIVVGSVRTSEGNRAFRYDRATGVCTLYGNASTTNTYYTGITDAGAIVGWSCAFGPTCTPRPIAPAGTTFPTGGSWTRAEGINESGQIVGLTSGVGGFVTDEDGPVIVGEGTDCFWPYGINDLGHIVFSPAATLIDGVCSPLEMPAEWGLGSSGWGQDINDAGDIVGFIAYGPNNTQAVAWIARRAAECTDADGDGYGSDATGRDGCAFPELDCDDGNPAVNPGAAEIPGNGVDDDCDPETPVGCQAAR